MAVLSLVLAFPHFSRAQGGITARTQGGITLAVSPGPDPRPENTQLWEIPLNVAEASPARGYFLIKDTAGLLSGKVLRIAGPDWLDLRYDPASVKPGQTGSLSLALKPDVKVLSTTNEGTFNLDLLAEGHGEPVARKEVKYTLVTMPPSMELPERVDDAVVGMDGGMLFTFSHQGRNLFAVDIAAGKVVKTIELPAGKIVAAGKSHLVVSKDDGKTLTRWNLPGFDGEFSRKLEEPISKLWIGSGQDRVGLAAVKNGRTTDWYRLELATLELKPAPVAPLPPHLRGEVAGGRVSANGLVAAITPNNRTPFAMVAMVKGAAEGELAFARVEGTGEQFLPNATGTHFIWSNGIVIGAEGNREIYQRIQAQVPFVDSLDVLYWVNDYSEKGSKALYRAPPMDRSSPLLVGKVANVNQVFDWAGAAGGAIRRFWPVHRLGKIAVIGAQGDRIFFLKLEPGVAAPEVAKLTLAKQRSQVAAAPEEPKPATLRVVLSKGFSNGPQASPPRIVLDLDPAFVPSDDWTLSMSFQPPTRQDTPVQVVLPEWLASDLPVDAAVPRYGQRVKFRPRLPSPVKFNESTNLVADIRFFIQGQEEPVAVLPIEAVLYQSTPGVVLPGPARDACLGMDGRILLVASANSNTVHAVDLVAGKIVGRADIGGDYKFASGKECLITYNTNLRKLARWSLPDLKLTAEVPRQAELAGIFLGASQARAALAIGYGENHKPGWFRIDLATLRDEAESRPVTGAPQNLITGGENYRTSALGHATAVWTSHFGFEDKMIRVGNQMISVSYPSQLQTLPIFPSSRGERFFRAGALLGESRERATDSRIRGRNDEAILEWLIPSEDSDNVLKITLPPVKSTGGPPVTALTLMSPDGSVELRRLSPMIGQRFHPQRSYGSALDFGKRFWFSERMQVLAAIPEGETRVLLASTKPSTAESAPLAKLPLQVLSNPSEGFRPGDMFQSVLRATGGTAPYAWRMVSGPPGMTISPEGKLAWDTGRQPIAETLEVAVEARDAAGGTARHALRLVNVAVHPDIAGKGFTSSVRVSETRGVSFCHLADRSGSVVIDGEEAIRLDAAGRMTGARIKLKRVYESIASRPNYLLALDEEGVDFLNPQTLAVLRRVSLPGNGCYKLEPHPGGPVSYISAVKMDERGGSKVLYELQEDKGVAAEIRGFLGENPRVTPDGLRLLASFTHSEVVGLRHHPFLGFMTQVQELNLLLAYDISGPVVKCLAADSPGPACAHLAVSPAGDAVTYVSTQGTTSDAVVPAYDTRDPRRLKVKYPMPTAGVLSFAYHPTHDLAVVGGANSLKAFSASSGASAAVWPAEPPTGFRPVQLGFSADGRYLIAVGAPGHGPEGFLATMPIRLSGIPARAAGPRPAAPVRHTNGAPVEGVLSAVGGGKVMDPTVGLQRFGPATGLAEAEGVRGQVLTRKITARQLAAGTRGGVVLIRSEDSTCTGFFIGSSGYVLSCAHGIRSGTATVRYMAGDKGGNAQEERPAVVIARDDHRDLCLLKLTAIGSRPVPMILSRARKIEMGEPVTVIGNPGAGDGTVLDFTMSEGIVSSPNRVLGNQKLIQTSAAVNPGNSGGPLFDEFGNVIGVITSKADLENVGFAIPAEVVMEFLRDCARPAAPAAAPGR